MKKSDRIVENTWDLEYDEWFQELQKRRLDYVEKGEKNQDPLFELGDRCWGDINGRLSKQYFQLMTELENTNTDLYQKYSAKINQIMSFFLFDMVTREQYKEFIETGYIKDFIDKRK